MSDEPVAASLRAAGAREAIAALAGPVAADDAGRPTDLELVRRVAARVGRSADTPGEVIEAGLSLLAAAREELDGIEATLLRAARGSGLTWAAVAAALGLGSAQAAHQRCERLATRGWRR